MHQQSINFDVCARKHQGNPESVAAFGPGKHAQRQRVYEAIREAGEHGITVDELATRWGVGSNCVSGRFTELRMQERIEKHGRRRTSTGSMAGVWRVKL